MSDNIKLQEKWVDTITELVKKYGDNDYMTHRINNHIVHYLPQTLENEFINYNKRKTRNSFLTNAQQIFIQVFLSKNQYFYLPYNNEFYEYNGKKYLIVKKLVIGVQLISILEEKNMLVCI